MEDTMRDLLSKLDQILNESVEVKETDNNKKDNWIRNPEDPESKIPAVFRKSKQAGKDSAKKSIDDLNKDAGAKVWKTAREDQDVEESGLQYHIGKKKYGKDGMKALAQAGRDGADEEDLGRIKDKFKKEGFEIGDEFGISFSEDFEIGTHIVDIVEDGVVIELDEDAINYLSENGFTFEEGELVEGKQHGNSKIYDKCWKGYKKVPGKSRGGPGSCEKISESEIKESPSDIRDRIAQRRTDIQDRLSSTRSRISGSQSAGPTEKPAESKLPQVGDRIEWGIFNKPERKIGNVTKVDKLTVTVKTDTGEEVIHLGNKSLNYKIIPKRSSANIKEAQGDNVFRVGDRIAYGHQYDSEGFKEATIIKIDDRGRGRVLVKNDQGKLEVVNLHKGKNEYDGETGKFKGRPEDEGKGMFYVWRLGDLEKQGTEDDMYREKTPFGTVTHHGAEATARRNIAKYGNPYGPAAPDIKGRDPKTVELHRQQELEREKKRKANAEIDSQDSDDDAFYNMANFYKNASPVERKQIEAMPIFKRDPEKLQQLKDFAGVEEGLDEAEYQGRKVPLGKPMAGDVKKSKVYVKNDKGNVVKVNFGDKKMKIKKSNPSRRKSFRARHNCSNPGPRWKARYWSCRAW